MLKKIIITLALLCSFSAQADSVDVFIEYANQIQNMNIDNYKEAGQSIKDTLNADTRLSDYQKDLLNARVYVADRALNEKANDIGNTYTSMNNTDIGTIFANGKASFDAISELVKYIAYIIGMFLVVKSIKGFIDSQNDPRHAGTTGKYIFIFSIGIALFSLPSVVELTANTMGMGSGPGDLLSPPGGEGAGYQAAISGVVAFVKLVGYIAFIRGWLFLVDYSNGKQDGTMSRGLVHIAGGVAAINLYTTVQILVNTFVPAMSKYIT